MNPAFRTALATLPEPPSGARYVKAGTAVLVNGFWDQTLGVLRGSGPRRSPFPWTGLARPWSWVSGRAAVAPPYPTLAASKRSRSQSGMGVARKVFMSTVTATLRARKTGLPRTEPS